MCAGCCRVLAAAQSPLGSPSALKGTIVIIRVFVLVEYIYVCRRFFLMGAPTPIWCLVAGAFLLSSVFSACFLVAPLGRPERGAAPLFSMFLIRLVCIAALVLGNIPHSHRGCFCVGILVWLPACRLSHLLLLYAQGSRCSPSLVRDGLLFCTRRGSRMRLCRLCPLFCSFFV